MSMGLEEHAYGASLTVLVGIPGCGKTTYAKRIANNNDSIHLSSDVLRGVIGKDESDQNVSHQAFKTMETMAEYFLKQGKHVIIDATNLSKKSRKVWIDIAKKYTKDIRAVVFKTPLKECLTRNGLRERVVPEGVIQKMHQNMEPVDEQGFHDVSEYPTNNYE